MTWIVWFEKIVLCSNRLQTIASSCAVSISWIEKHIYTKHAKVNMIQEWLRCIVFFTALKFHFNGSFQWRQDLNFCTSIISIALCRKCQQQCNKHDDVIKWKHYPRYWPFVRGIHRVPVNSPLQGQWCGALMCFLSAFWINGWVWWFETPSRSLRRHCNDLHLHHQSIIQT